MRVAILASGSRGNATLVEGGGVGLLVDAGYSPRTLRRRMRALLGRVPERLDAVLVTHAHGDHARYGADAARSFCARLLATEETAAARGLEAETIVPGTSTRLGSLELLALAVPHDAPQVALVLDDGRERVGIATDLGVVPPGLVDHLSGCATVLVESNHDPAMLAGGPYPPDVKARVASSWGHLSNAQAGALLAALPTTLRTVVLMHLSETNNRPEVALAAARRALAGRRVRLLAASQREPLLVDVSAGDQIPLPLTCG